MAYFSGNYCQFPQKFSDNAVFSPVKAEGRGFLRCRYNRQFVTQKRRVSACKFGFIIYVAIISSAVILAISAL